ncbi:hypothetical protein [uncultured Mediterranean phage]|nr:hypothetical protein [uncultured Mediterranean phage]
MGLLDEDAQIAVEAMIEESFAAEDAAESQSMEPDPSDGEQDVNEESQGDGEAAAEAQGDSSPEAEAAESTGGAVENSPQKGGPPDMIPYSRFREENHRYRDMQSQNADLQKKLDAMQKQVADAANSPSGEDQYGAQDPFADMFGEQDPAAQAPDQLQALGARLDAFEERHRMNEGEKLLDAKLEEVRADYPDVPEDVLYQAVIDHKSLDAMRVYADRYVDMVKHYKKLGADEAAAAAAPAAPGASQPPRVPKSGNPSMTVDDEPVPTMTTAREGVERMLRQSGFFDS